MKKLRFKNRGGVLYFGFGDKLKSSKMKYTNINKNLLIQKFKDGLLDDELNINQVSNAPTIENLLKEVMDSKSKVLKHKTLLAYKVTCRTKIIPYFKDMLVTQIKPIDIKKFQDYLMNKNLGKGTINLTRVLLKQVFNLAILNEYITLNPIKMVDMPQFKKRTTKQEPFT